MMRKQKQLRMTLSFENEYKMSLLRGLACEEALLNRTSESYEIVNRFIDSFNFPKDPDAEQWAKDLYRGRGISEVLRNIFAWYAVRAEMDSRYGNGRPIVQFAYEQGLRWYLDIDPENSAYAHFMSNFEMLVKEIKREAEQEKNKANYVLREEAENGETLMQLYWCEIPPTYSAFMSYVLLNWEIIGNSTWVFRALTSYIAISVGWKDRVEVNKEKVNLLTEDAIEARHKLIKIIKQVSSEWES